MLQVIKKFHFDCVAIFMDSIYLKYDIYNIHDFK